MSRLEEECIMYIGRNRSGMDSGEIDYGLFVSKFERMDVDDLERALLMMNGLYDKINERILELRQAT